MTERRRYMHETLRALIVKVARKHDSDPEIKAALQAFETAWAMGAIDGSGVPPPAPGELRGPTMGGGQGLTRRPRTFGAAMEQISEWADSPQVLVSRNESDLRRRFPHLDGCAGRPTIIDAVTTCYESYERKRGQMGEPVAYVSMCVWIAKDSAMHARSHAMSKEHVTIERPVQRERPVDPEAARRVREQLGLPVEK